MKRPFLLNMVLFLSLILFNAACSGVKTLNGNRGDLTLEGGTNVSITTTGTTLTVASTGANTLDQAYDQGGSAGAGRTITADNGPVQISGSDGLLVEGTTTTDVLTITGGIDIAELFQISASKNVPVGAVVVIDEENPGMLKLSQRDYDTRVAGVVSGAGGIKPGIVLTQDSSTEKRQNVAIGGRVYVLADASNGPIRPGDLLTTSNTPGHAMKVNDHVKANGAILGKAMSSLPEGKGLVLMLVSLL